MAVTGCGVANPTKSDDGSRSEATQHVEKDSTKKGEAESKSKAISERANQLLEDTVAMEKKTDPVLLAEAHAVQVKDADGDGKPDTVGEKQESKTLAPGDYMFTVYCIGTAGELTVKFSIGDSRGESIIPCSDPQDVSSGSGQLSVASGATSLNVDITPSEGTVAQVAYRLDKE